MKQRLKGPVFSVVTPFTRDESIDVAALEAYLHRIYDAGGRVFYVMGYNSRFSELSDEEIKRLNEMVTTYVKGMDEHNIVIVADPLHCSTRASVEFCRHAEEIGADVISLIFREKYYSNVQVFKHFEKCAQSTEIGILVHEMPFLSGYGGPPLNYPVELLDQLADIENIIAIKEDAKDDVYSKSVIETVRDRVSIIISGGGKRQWLRFVDDGCQAWLNGIGVFEPALAVRFWTDYKAGRLTECQAMVDEIEVPFFKNVVARYGWHLAIKAALEARGLMSRHERMPLLALGQEDASHVRALIEQLPIDRFI